MFKVNNKDTIHDDTGIALVSLLFTLISRLVLVLLLLTLSRLMSGEKKLKGIVNLYLSKLCLNKKNYSPIQAVNPLSAKPTKQSIGNRNYLLCLNVKNYFPKLFNITCVLAPECSFTAITSSYLHRFISRFITCSTTLLFSFIVKNYQIKFCVTRG